MATQLSLIPALIIVSIQLTGCIGLAVGTFGKHEYKQDDFKISLTEKNKFEIGLVKSRYTKDQIIAAWGMPDASEQIGTCEVLRYRDGLSWSGFGAFLLFLPVPVLIPTGYLHNSFYLQNGEAVAVTKESGEVISALGYACGSNDCDYLSNAKKKERKVSPNWCFNN